MHGVRIPTFDIITVLSAGSCTSACVDLSRDTSRARARQKGFGNNFIN